MQPTTKFIDKNMTSSLLYLVDKLVEWEGVTVALDCGQSDDVDNVAVDEYDFLKIYVELPMANLDQPGSMHFLTLTTNIQCGLDF